MASNMGVSLAPVLFSSLPAELGRRGSPPSAPRGKGRSHARRVRLLEAHLDLELGQDALRLDLARLALHLDAVDVQAAGGDSDGGLGRGDPLLDLVQVLVGGGGGSIRVELGQGTCHFPFKTAAFFDS